MVAGDSVGLWPVMVELLGCSAWVGGAEGWRWLVGTGGWCGGSCCGFLSVFPFDRCLFWIGFVC